MASIERHSSFNLKLAESEASDEVALAVQTNSALLDASFNRIG